MSKKIDNPLSGFLQSLEPDIQPTPGKPPEFAFHRYLRDCEPPQQNNYTMTVQAARNLIYSEMEEYISYDYDNMMLVRASAGVGKTTAGVRAAELAASRGLRVGYVGPRHDFFGDIMLISKNPEMWYEWMPRTLGDDEGIGRTCEYAPQIERWMKKGYQSMDFCSGVCGWDVINKNCVYHAQKRRREPIIFIQHNHITHGHPIKFDILIGDENPLGSFTNKMRVKVGEIVPPGLTPGSPLHTVLSVLSSLAATQKGMLGRELIDALGGHDIVLEAMSMNVPLDAIGLTRVYSLYEAESAPPFNLPVIAYLLNREATLHKAGVDYIGRIIASKGKGDGGITMMMRRSVSDTMPKKKIWLDATGEPRIYETIFKQPVNVIDAMPKIKGRITTIVDRAYGKSDIVGNETQTRKAESIIKHLETGRTGIVTFQKLLDGNIAEGRDVLNFYGARGTNSLEACNSLFVLGTPMPAQDVIEGMAAMVFFERDHPFKTKWSDRWIKYNCQAGKEYSAGGYWDDPDLQSLLWQVREAEIIQSVHRARPIFRDVDIYLLSNLPIPELPIDNILTSSDVCGLKPGDNLNSYKWMRFLDWVEDKNQITLAEISELLYIKAVQSKRYATRLVDEKPEEWRLIKLKIKIGRGAPSWVLQRITFIHA